MSAPTAKKGTVKRARRNKPDDVTPSQRNWRMDFAKRHGITTPLLDPDPKPPKHTFGPDTT